MKTSSLGDVVHALPATCEALAAVPGLVLDWAVEPAFADVLRLQPGVRRIWPTPLRRWRRDLMRPARWRAAGREIGALTRALRRERYDLVLDAQGLFKSVLVARLAGPRVVGLDRASSRGGPVTALYSRAFAVPPERHAVDRMRLLFGAALGYRPALDRPAPGLLEAGPVPRLEEAAASRRAFLLHGTTWPSKHWPLGQWVSLAEGLLTRGYRPAVTFADAAEEGTARALAAAVPEVEIVGPLTLGEVAAGLAGSALVVGVDTGLMHLAAVLGRPTIALFASTPPGQTEPRGSRVAVLAATTPCAPCSQRRCPLVPEGADPPCQATIGPIRVLAQIDQWNASAPG